MPKPRKKSPAMKLLDGLVGEPMTFGHMLRTLRECKPWTQDALARKLGISRNHLSDVERGKKTVSAERALRWAKLMGGSAHQFVELALQGEVDAAGMKARVRVEAANDRSPSIEAFRRLQSALSWYGHNRGMPEADRRGAISMERVLRTLAVAVVRGDKRALDDLERLALKQGRRMRDERKAEEGKDFGGFQPLGRYSRFRDDAMPMDDWHPTKGAARAAYVQNWVAELDHRLQQRQDARWLAERFIESANPFANHILDEHAIELGPWQDRESAEIQIKKVAARYEKVLEKPNADGERLLVAGLRALGMPKQAAEATKDSKRKREDRSAKRDK